MSYNYKLVMVSILFFASSVDCSFKKFANAGTFGNYFKNVEQPLSQEEFYKRLDQCCSDHVDNPFFQEGKSLAANFIESSVTDKNSWKFDALKQEVEGIARTHRKIFAQKKMDQEAADKLFLFMCGIYAKLRDICASGEIDILIQKCNARCGQYAQKWDISSVELYTVANNGTPESEALLFRQYFLCVKEAMTHKNRVSGEDNFEEVLSGPLSLIGIAL